MKTALVKLSREQAKEALGQIEMAARAQVGLQARETVVKLLNSIPTYTWVGLYLVSGNDLVLDAWAGPAATVHSKIPIGKGICGFAAKTGRTEIISDVNKDSRYLQCFLSTKAEIVVPVMKDGRVVGEIDVDGDMLDAFSSVDQEFLEAVASKVSAHWL